MQTLSTHKLIERISTLMRAEERKKFSALGLQPIHIQVLDFLNSCNSYSNTAASVTEYFSLTKGTVSQTLQVLERKGYLDRTQDMEDGRIIHLTLTAPGLELLTDMNTNDFLAQAEQSVLSKKFSSLAEALSVMLLSLQRANNCKTFGTCDSCANFDIEENHYLCAATRLPLLQAETHKICREHIPADAYPFTH